MQKPESMSKLCFALHISDILVTATDYTMKLMTYMIGILRTSLKHEGTASLTYDRA